MEDSYWLAEHCPLLFLVVGHTKKLPLIGPLGTFSIYSKHKGCSIAEEVVKQLAVCYVAHEVCHEH